MMKELNSKAGKLTLIVLITTALVFGFSRCKEDDPVLKYYDFKNVSYDMMLAYLIHTEAYFRIDHVFRNLNDSLAVYPDGIYTSELATITIDPPDTLNYPKSFVFDYGDVRALDSITGQITGTISAPYQDNMCKVAFSFNDYIVDGNQVFGSDSISNNGVNSDLITYTFEVRNSYMIKDAPEGDPDSVSFEMILYPAWSEMNQSTSSTQGYVSGMGAEGLSFSMEVRNSYPLIKDADCEFFRDGIFNYIVKSTDSEIIGEGIVDFGYPDPSVCDKYSIIVVDGNGYRQELEFIMD